MTMVAGEALDALLNKDNFTSLVELDLDLMPFRGKGLVYLHSLYPRLAQLKKFSIAGSLYLEETEALMSRQLNFDPWKLESLCAPRQHLRILRMCGHLRRLELTNNQESVEPTSLSPLLSCLELQELIFAKGGFNLLDCGRTLPHLNALTLLKVAMSRQEQISQLHILTDKHTSPALRHLELTYLPTAASRQEQLAAPCQDLMVKILATRKRMEVFILEGVAIEAATFFRMGKEVTDEPCLNLKQVWLEIFSTTLVEKDSTAREAAWDLMYSQLRLTDTLRNITLTSLGLQATIERGFGMLGQIPNLKEFTLIDPTAPTWSTDQLVAVLRATPRLRALNLKPLSENNRAKVIGWLQECGRADFQL